MRVPIRGDGLVGRATGHMNVPLPLTFFLSLFFLFDLVASSNQLAKGVSIWAVQFAPIRAEWRPAAGCITLAISSSTVMKFLDKLVTLALILDMPITRKLFSNLG